MSLSRRFVVTRVQSIAGNGTRPLSATDGTRRGLNAARGTWQGSSQETAARDGPSTQRAARGKALITTACSTLGSSTLRAVRAKAPHHHGLPHATAFDAACGTRHSPSPQPAERGHARPGRFVRAGNGGWSRPLVAGVVISGQNPGHELIRRPVQRPVRRPVCPLPGETRARARIGLPIGRRRVAPEAAAGYPAGLVADGPAGCGVPVG